MKLKEFIDDTLTQIVAGVRSAQEKAGMYGAIVSPREATLKTIRINDKCRSVEWVEFEVVLSETNSGGGAGKVSVDLMSFFKADIGSGGNRENGTRTNIKFRVPIVLPGIDNGNRPQVNKGRQVPGDGLSTF